MRVFVLVSLIFRMNLSWKPVIAQRLGWSAIFLISRIRTWSSVRSVRREPSITSISLFENRNWFLAYGEYPGRTSKNRCQTLSQLQRLKQQRRRRCIIQCLSLSEFRLVYIPLYICTEARVESRSRNAAPAWIREPKLEIKSWHVTRLHFVAFRGFWCPVTTVIEKHRTPAFSLSPQSS